ncbi:ATP-dependent RNA helicase HrpA [Xanthomonas campestris pv. campestris]|uniref:ATP-dependent RNA helicase HrpA n=1 Tax=Xanthomonas campestris TaxID=339 RepID=UPI002368E580|nr:ATP-dependent RNA helicase HrpA [Xanthomonas campestris]MDO0844750.1 ATP-dependent RNA helicase HrpA [Xanthomonas campestris pv. campestris]MEB1412470.1 ATP-dependent RNA helicase HrpA [Xanthomonas campestris pv. campestris]MEB1458205.1 ATP-dependent RNA helicase HrpA [Xanthomonas campestris pv. campestris]MEB1499365.1 ATP-dependent RNA helicase HrpA [Xanthomonas campestris pv. campestris]MEB1523659.1 ATP-dependent RNA helicase HrpA [Xanthomonas campestris pv. campestris]
MSAIDTDLATTLRERRGAVDAAMSRDRGRLLGLWSRWQGKPGNPQLRQAFEQALAASQAQRQARAAQQPAITLDTQLPIAREADRIIALIRDHPVVVIAGETGSGKTTQLPKLCLAAGRGAAGMIGCTQPRRIAARAVAARVAEELNTPLGTTVGFQVRFTDRVGEDSRIKFMTDGILLAEIASDRWLSAYDTIIVDEAHERSLNIDFLLGYLKQLLRKRPDLKLIVTSATIDTERFSRHFDDAPVINVEGRTFPVDVRYRPLEGESGDGDTGDVGRDGERTVNDAIVAAIDEITRIDPRGDVLMFLPGEREIRDAHQSLERRKYRETEVVPLYARLSAADQDRVFNPGPRRRLVLATNVAETSLTVPRIRYVVDPGYARVKRYSPRQKLDRLHIEPISQASANQRMGRCGRIAEGICYRLYAEADFAARPAFTDPEIRRASLSGVILRMLQLGLGRIEEFPFLEAPDERAVADGWQQLLELGAIDAERRLTAIGRQMARLPVDVKLARMLVAAQQHGCLREMIIIAAFLGIQDPRERPPEAREAADNAHALFADARSEFVGILRLWDAYRQVHEDLTQSKLRDWCGRHFLGFLRMREWRELHRQLRLLCEELGWSEEPAGAMLAPLLAGASAPVREDGQAHRATRGQLHRAARLAREGKPDPAAPPAQAKAAAAKSSPADATDAAVRTSERERAAAYQALHRALLAGLPTQIGHRTEKGDFLAARQRRFVPFPGSALARKPPPWILAATLLDTQKVWGMTNAAIEPDWAIAELPHLLARKHFDPRWSRAQGQVVASEQISLFGLVLAPKKPVHFGKIDPATSHDLFVRQGLVPGEINTRAAFVADNLKVLEQAREEEAKLRRAGVVADEDWQARWYLDRIPAELHSASGLDAWWKTLPADKRRSLHWSLNDLLPGEGSEADRFPKYFALGDARLPLQYRFEPGAIDDGVTLEVPLHLLNALDPSRLSWLAPGFVADKASALIRSLPKAQRRNYVPAPDYGRAFYEAFSTPSADDMRGELARFLSKATGAPVAALDFDEEALDTHLLMNLRLRAEDGKVLAESRDLEGLRARFGERAGQAFAARAGRALAAEGLRDFPATPIPEQVAGEAGVPAYPALVDQGEDAALRIFADRNEALRAHPRGVRRLLEIALADKIKQARKQLPVSPKTGLLYAAIESQERLRGDLVDAALNAVLAEGLGAIRDPAAFAQRREDAVKRLFGEAMARLTLAESILGAVAELKPLLEAPLMGWARGNLDDMEQQLRALVHAGFLRDTPADALANYPRYLKAMILRTERAKRDPARDQARMLELKPFVDALNDAAARGLQQHPDWQALRWDLEELRVSVFAQELGAKSGVSAKKLSQRVAALRG